MVFWIITYYKKKLSNLLWISYGHMSFHMQCKMIGSWKSSFAKSTLKGTVSSMLSVVSCKFVWSSKLPSTTFVMANVRFFSSVSSLVSLQMARLCIRFMTTIIWARVYNLFPFCPRSFLSGLSWFCHWYFGRLFQRCRSWDCCSCRYIRWRR